MGVKYSSAESTSLINAMESNIQVANEVSDRLSSGSDYLLSVLDSGGLQGAAYTAGRGLFSEVIIPAIKKLQEAIDDVQAELESYKTADSLVSGYGTLDLEELKQLKQQREEMLKAVESQIQSQNNFEKAFGAFLSGRLDSHLENLRILNDAKQKLESGIGKLEEKIEALENFVSTVSLYFSDSLTVLQSAIQGASQLSQIVVDSSGHYYTDGLDMTWLSTMLDQEIKTYFEGETPKSLVIDDNVNELRLSEVAEVYYRAQIEEILKGQPQEKWEEIIKLYNESLFFDDDGNIISALPVNFGAGDAYIIYKNGEIDKGYTERVNDEINAKQWENFWSNAGELTLGALNIVGGIVLYSGSAAIGAGGLALALPTGGTVTIPAVAVASAGMATGGTVAVAGSATVTDAIIRTLVANQQIEISFAKNYKEYKSNVPTSKSFGRKVSGRLQNGRKVDNIRVDGEWKSEKIQVQSGSGKGGYSLDIEMGINEISSKQDIIRWVKKSPELRGIGKGGKEEIVENMWKAYKWIIEMRKGLS